MVARSETEDNRKFNRYGEGSSFGLPSLRNVSHQIPYLLIKYQTRRHISLRKASLIGAGSLRLGREKAKARHSNYLRLQSEPLRSPARICWPGRFRYLNVVPLLFHPHETQEVVETKDPRGSQVKTYRLRFLLARAFHHDALFLGHAGEEICELTHLAGLEELEKSEIPTYKRHTENKN